ncbi:MAG: ribonuclease III [Bacteroidales bacterium]|nr:ribonuclease III [Bacteroidales bacterium]
MIFSKGLRTRLKFTKFLGFIPGNFYLYKLAFIHSSAPLKLHNGSLLNNERLEFLGDAILEAIVSDIIYKQFPNKNEGFLSKVRARIVQRDTLNHIAVDLGIPQLLQSQINKDNTTLNPFGNALESLLGAIYLDKGYNKTKKYVVKKILSDNFLTEEIITNGTDFKSQILEWGQKNKNEIIFSNEEMPNNYQNEHLFFSTLIIENQKAGSGKGMSKKEAEQNAAEQALLRIKNGN